MDLLSKAYASPSDDEDGDGGAGVRFQHSDPLSHPPPKRARPDTPFSTKIQMPLFRLPNLPAEAPIPGSYISKRQRAALASNPNLPDPGLASIAPCTGSLSDADLPHGIFTALRRQKKDSVVSNQTPQSLSAALRGHVKSVNSLQWSRSHDLGLGTCQMAGRFDKTARLCLLLFPAHLLASAGMDHTVRIWNVWSKGQNQVRVLNCHNAAVKDVKWSRQGLSVLSCGYDCTSRLVDVEKGMEAQVFKEDQFVEVVKFCPDNYNLFLSGGSKGQLKLWDIRTRAVAHEYVRSLGPILDVEFTVDGKYLITSSDVSKSNLSENSIVVWDVSRQVPLSNQVYAEAYTCPCIRCHPSEPHFIAQSNGNYIAIFSTRPPFKLDKYKRYEGHGVSGFPIKCNFSSDGNFLASGSFDGYIYFYDSKTTKFLKKVKAYEQACVDVAFHPSLPDVIASCSWNGEISVLHQNCNKI